MCSPALIVAGVSLAIGAGGEIARAKAQNKAAKQNAKNAAAALGEDFKALSLQEVQLQNAEQRTIMDADRQARNADALARASAGEAGVAGASVTALLGDLKKQAADFRLAAERNLDMGIAQIQQEKRGAVVQAQSRINAVQPANPFATALTIGSMGLDFASNAIRQKPTGT